MNTLFWITVSFLIIMTIIGLKKGFVKIAYTLLSMTLSLLLVSFLSPYVQDFLLEKTSLYDKALAVCVERIEGQIATGQGEVELENFLPIALTDIMTQLEEETNQQIESATTKMAASVANWLIYGVSYIISFVVVLLVMKILGGLLDLVTKLPVLKGANRLLGMIAGFIQGILILWVAALLLSMCCTTNFGQQILCMVNENNFLQFLYNYNGIIYLAVLFL